MTEAATLLVVKHDTADDQAIPQNDPIVGIGCEGDLAGPVRAHSGSLNRRTRLPNWSNSRSRGE
jgi:hypothetical protein